MKFLLSILPLLFYSIAFSQTNVTSSNIKAEQVLQGDYDPSSYLPKNVIDDKDIIIDGIKDEVSPDSLKKYIIQLSSFKNRNSASDTISENQGIGAARRWVFNKFAAFSASNDDRLLTSFLLFDQEICTVNKHKNVFAVLPGTDTANSSIVLIEGHMDSRCEALCDTDCIAEGVEDNASGTALVLELARVMSKYSFKNTIVFMATTGEEQGLYGARAFAEYALDNSIVIKAVYNNDVIGGITCGETSSEPSCPGLNAIDSTQVRLFSFGSFASSHKNLARFVKLQYKEELLHRVTVPMQITIMSAEDRAGRGGDHIPFRVKGIPSIRFTSANEHGNGGNGVSNYNDRQHTTTDILGADTNNDEIIDSFFVDFNYLARNAVINGVAASMTAIGPSSPKFEASADSSGLLITITEHTSYPSYRVAVRSDNNDWDSVYTINSISEKISLRQSIQFISVASVDSFGVESLFSREKLLNVTDIEEHHHGNKKSVELLQNRPNPFDEATTISVKVNSSINYKTAYILIADINGKTIGRLPVNLDKEINETIYHHGYGKTGVFSYSLIVDGKKMETKKMIFAN